MQILRPCQICGQAIAKHNCKSCGAYVCEYCLTRKGICVKCNK